MATGERSRLQRLLTPSKTPEVDEQILFNESFTLNCSDLDVLSVPFCINSRIIDFYFSLLSEVSQCTRAGNVLLVPTSVSYSICRPQKFDFEELYETVGKYNLREKEISIFVVDDCDDASDNQTWRHWSLLVYVKKQNLFLHHDSREEANEPHAKKLYNILKPFLGGPELVECRTPQQTHFEDSGLFVMAIAREICAWCDLGLDKDSDQLWFSELEKMNGTVADDTRKEFLALINVLMDEDEDPNLTVDDGADDDNFDSESRAGHGVDDDKFDSELRARRGVLEEFRSICSDYLQQFLA